MKTIAKTLLLALIVFCFAAPVSAVTFIVTTTADTQDVNPGNGLCDDSGGNCSVRAAITEVNALAGDDTITIPAGFYTQSIISADENVNAGGDWDITSNVTINGSPDLTDPNNPVLVVLQAANAPNTATERVLHVASPAAVVTVNFVVIRFGRKGSGTAANVRGGGLNNAGTLTLANSSVTDNRAPEGGGIFNSATITLNNTSVQSNTAANGGPAGYGGGMYSLTSPTSPPNSTVTINNSFFINNIMNCQTTTCYAMGGGLAINASSPATVSIDKTLFSGNQVNGGGGPGSGVGGGIGGGLRMETGFGAASTLNITNSTFQFNTGSGLQNSTQAGMGVYLWANNASLTATLDKVKFNGNFATAAQGTGLHVASANGSAVATVNTRNSTFSGNHDGAAGGAVYLFGSTSLTANFTNSTFSGNSVSAAGGAISTNGNLITANFDYCTITNNSSAGIGGGGGGISSQGGAVNLSSSIVSNNTGPAGPDISGTVTSNDYNHIGNATGAAINGTTTNNSTGDALLGPLQNNGGPTLTHVPAANSPVVNAVPNGVNGCGTTFVTDQRGLARPDSVLCDKGSVERYANDEPPFDIGGTVTDSVGRPIRNAIVTLTGPGLPQPLITFTGTFGNFNFANLPPGSYDVSATAKRFRFTITPSQHVELTTDTALVFAADPTFAGKISVKGGSLAMESVPGTK